MTNVRTTVTSLLSTIETTATSATKFVSTTGRAIDMLDRYVGEHQHKQALRIAIERETYKSELLNRTTLALSKEEERIQRELDNNPILTQKFESNYKKLDAILSAVGKEMA